MSAISLQSHGVWITIAAMTAVTFAIRAGGFLLMQWVPVTPRLRAMLDALPGAVIAATVLPLVLRDGISAMLAVVVALAVMAASRNDFIAVTCGIGAVVLARALSL
ncbi:MAG TPA: AzlD domain-containing protein [Pseudolabrys sp.]|nr:AzlD domain-containing protein [Pseudolabrys sp.]